MSDHTALHILQQVYNNSLEEDASKVYNTIDSLKISLRRHQHAVIDRMCKYEEEFIEGKQINNSKLYCKYGILGDSVGVGKTFMVLGHIGLIKNNRNTIDFSNFNINSNKNLYSLEKQEVKDLSNVGCLIIVPHTLFRQWSDEITSKTNLKVALMKSKKNVWSDSFMKNVKEADIVLISNTLFKELYIRSNELKLHWNRIYIDEADTIELVSSILNTPLPTNFVWLISASFSNILFSHNYNIYIYISIYNTFKLKNVIHPEMEYFL